MSNSRMTPCMTAVTLAVCLVAGRSAKAQDQSLNQWADRVLGFSTQYSASGWSAAQALGPPSLTIYGDNSAAWAPQKENGTQEYIAVGFAFPVYATGVTIRETWGNGFVTKIEAIDMNDTLHTVWTGTDPSLPGTAVNYTVNWTKTAYAVKGVKITVNTDHNLNTWEEIDAIQLNGIDTQFGQLASRVTGFSSQYTTVGWSAAQALGPPDTPQYGDYATAWTPANKNGTQEYLQLDYDTPVYAFGAVIWETYGNGFVTQVDAVDTAGALHTVWMGTDPSQPGTPTAYYLTWTKTAYLVKGLRIHVNTDHNLNTWEEIDAVRLYGDPPPGIAGTILLQASEDLAQPITFAFRPKNGGAAITRQQTLGPDGSFVFDDVPAGDYNLAVKGKKWLRTVAPVDAASGDAYGIVILLPTGDVNNDNSVDIQDLSLMADAFFTAPGDTSWNPNADLNGDDTVDIADLSLLADNFFTEGAP